MHCVWGTQRQRRVKNVTRLYCSTGEHKYTSGSFKPLFGLISSNWLKSFLIVCTCLYVEQLPRPGEQLDISSEAKWEKQYDNNWVSWWLDEPEWATREWCSRLTEPECWGFRDGGISKRSTTAVMLTSLSLVRKHFMSSRCYNYCTCKLRGKARQWKIKERERRKVIPTHHSASCCRGVAERFIDHLRMHSVSADNESGENGWCDGMKERRREGRKPIWMSESEGICSHGLIDNDIPAWAVR